MDTPWDLVVNVKAARSKDMSCECLLRAERVAITLGVFQLRANHGTTGEASPHIPSPWISGLCTTFPKRTTKQHLHLPQDSSLPISSRITNNLVGWNELILSRYCQKGRTSITSHQSLSSSPSSFTPQSTLCMRKESALVSSNARQRVQSETLTSQQRSANPASRTGSSQLRTSRRAKELTCSHSYSPWVWREVRSSESLTYIERWQKSLCSVAPQQSSIPSISTALTHLRVWPLW